MEISGLNALSTNMASAMAVNTNASVAWVKRNLFPARKSWVSDFTVFSSVRFGRFTAKVDNMAAEKTKLAKCREKQDCAEKNSTREAVQAGAITLTAST